MRFEYKTVPIVGAQSTAELNAAGAHGWEAVGLAPLADGIVALMKRPLDATESAPATQLTAAAFVAASQPAAAPEPPAAVVDTDTAEASGPGVRTVAHPRWAAWLASAADGGGERLSVVGTFWELYEASGFDPDHAVIDDLATTACRLHGVEVPEFANP